MKISTKEYDGHEECFSNTETALIAGGSGLAAAAIAAGLTYWGTKPDDAAAAAKKAEKAAEKAAAETNKPVAMAFPSTTQIVELVKGVKEALK